MASLSTRLRYFVHKLDYTISYFAKEVKSDASNGEITNALWKSFNDKLTYLHWSKGEAMIPTLGESLGTLLVRKLPAADPRYVFVGDVVVLKNPESSNDYLVRRLAAMGGHEMVSTDEKDESFVLEKDECWVLADNESLKPKEARDSRIFGSDPMTLLVPMEAKDSRIFGPVPMTSIVGRVIYSLQNYLDHGPVVNSPISMIIDSPVLQVELDVEELKKNHKE